METIVLGIAFGFAAIISFIAIRKLGTFLDKMKDEEDREHKEE